MASFVLAVFAAGCSAPSEPPSPPTGGDRPELSTERFATVIEPLLTRHGCAAEGDCHGGGIRGTYALSPRTAIDAEFDFEQSSLQVDARDAARSLLLLKPLAESAGGLPHAAKPFASREDPDYQALALWCAGTELP